jgi:glycerophosphoryl diester phosphodiesterase
VTLPAAFWARPFAHRGLTDRAAGVIENSRAAVAAAVAAGYGIELDLQLSADGQAMMFHDATLDRLTGETGPVHDRTADALRRITLSGGGEGETIPRFDEVLALVAGRVSLLVELKDQSGPPGAVPPAHPPHPGDRPAHRNRQLAEAAAAALVGYQGPVAVMSFAPELVAAFGACAPKRHRGLTTGAASGSRLAETAAAVGAVFLSHDVRDLDNPAVRAVQAAGLPVFCWTVRSPAAEARARRLAQQITFEGYRPA